jgi:hypothetical protein
VKKHVYLKTKGDRIKVKSYPGIRSQIIFGAAYFTEKTKYLFPSVIFLKVELQIQRQNGYFLCFRSVEFETVMLNLQESLSRIPTGHEF